jgi:hypothetical protein
MTQRDTKTLAKYFSIPVEEPTPQVRKGRKPTEASIERKLGKLMKFVECISVSDNFIDITWADGYQDDVRTSTTYYPENYQWMGGAISSADFYQSVIDDAKGLRFNPMEAYTYDNDERHLNAKPVE